MSWESEFNDAAEADNPDMSPLLEAGASLASGTAAQVGGLLGYGAMRLAGTPADRAADLQNQFQNFYTYQPRTPVGGAVLQSLGNGFEALANSRPVAAVADPIARALLSTGINPQDASHLVMAAGMLAGPEGRAANLIKEAPEVSAARAVSHAGPREPMVNIGLHVGDPANGGSVMEPAEAIQALKNTGVNVTRATVHTPEGGEPTLVASLDRNLTPDEAHELAVQTGQQAIPQRFPDAFGSMHGPGINSPEAIEQGWNNYSPDYFRMHAGQSATEAEQLMTDYPEPGAPIERTNDDGSTWLQKGTQQNPAALQFLARKRAMQADIDAGNYQPHYDVSQRYDVAPGTYPEGAQTLTQSLPAKQATIDKWTGQIDTPEAQQRLLQAYDTGMSPEAGDNGRWYHTGQMHADYQSMYGPEMGNALYKRQFADAMAATTANMAPTDNLLMANYANYMVNHGRALPTESWQLPPGIGGAYGQKNLAAYDAMLTNGGVPITSPKRYNFSGDFLGHGGSTIDKQMTNLIAPQLGWDDPANNTYGIFQAALNKAAAARGIAVPKEFQDVAWGGKKFADTEGEYRGMPMIQHANEAIERTSRFTGLSPMEAKWQALISGNVPLYGVGGLGLLGAFNQGDNSGL